MRPFMEGQLLDKLGISVGTVPDSQLDGVNSAEIVSESMPTAAAPTSLDSVLGQLRDASAWPDQLATAEMEEQQDRRCADAAAAAECHVEDGSPGMDSADTEYELFGVVIHSGDAYHGHYHAYIKDTVGKGSWMVPHDAWHIKQPVGKKKNQQAQQKKQKEQSGSNAGIVFLVFKCPYFICGLFCQRTQHCLTDIPSDPVLMMQRIMKKQKLDKELNLPCMVLDKVSGLF
jgi:hypothetical protein